MNSWILFLKEHKGMRRAEALIEYRKMYPVKKASKKRAYKKRSSEDVPLAVIKRRLAAKKKKSAKKGSRGKCTTSDDCLTGLVCSEKKRCRKPNRASKKLNTLSSSMQVTVLENAKRLDMLSIETDDLDFYDELVSELMSIVSLALKAGGVQNSHDGGNFIDTDKFSIEAGVLDEDMSLTFRDNDEKIIAPPAKIASLLVGSYAPDRPYLKRIANIRFVIKRHPAPKKKQAAAKKGSRGKCSTNDDCLTGLVCSEKKRCRKPKRASKKLASEDVPLAVIKRRLAAKKKRAAAKKAKVVSKKSSRRSSSHGGWSY